MIEDLTARHISIVGYNGDQIEAYAAEPLGAANVGGIVVIHHMPGFDRGTKEIVRRFAAMGYNAVSPNLYSRESRGASPDDAAAAARAAGGVPDERVVGDVDGTANYLRALPNANGKVGVIGHCSGGRHALLAACSLTLDAAVDCYGAFVTTAPPSAMGLKTTPIIDKVANLSCPLLGLFGVEDAYPTREEVLELELALEKHNKVRAFTSYMGAGHAFFAVDRPSYRPEAAVDGWQSISDWFGKYLSA